MTYRAPEPLTAAHDIAAFACGEPTMDAWLHRHALRNQKDGASRVFVVAEEDGLLAGYYALAAGSVEHVLAPRNVRRNMPDPIPVAILGRLAIDRRHAGKGLGRLLLRDAILRVIQASEHLGVRALLVHALNERAQRFYERFGFQASPATGLTLMMTLEKARAAVATATS